MRELFHGLKSGVALLGRPVSADPNDAAPGNGQRVVLRNHLHNLTAFYAKTTAKPVTAAGYLHDQAGVALQVTAEIDDETGLSFCGVPL
jgi:hypothetical protein